MSAQVLQSICCDGEGCDSRVWARTAEGALSMSRAFGFQRVLDVTLGFAEPRDYCPEHHIIPTATCVAGHLMVFAPRPWDANQRRPERCPACGEELTP